MSYLRLVFSMVALRARAGALSGSYFLMAASSFLICCFSRLANCFDSLHGVRPEMSAEAGSTGADKRTEESARAAENAFNDDDGDCSELPLLEELAEQRTVAALVGFVINLDVGLMGLERFVGIVSDIFVSSSSSPSLLLLLVLPG